MYIKIFIYIIYIYIIYILCVWAGQRFPNPTSRAPGTSSENRLPRPWYHQAQLLSTEERMQPSAPIQGLVKPQHT